MIIQCIPCPKCGSYWVLMFGKPHGVEIGCKNCNERTYIPDKPTIKEMMEKKDAPKTT